MTWFPKIINYVLFAFKGNFITPNRKEYYLLVLSLLRLPEGEQSFQSVQNNSH